MRSKNTASREYENAWSRVLAAIERQIDSGEGDGPRILRTVWGSLAREIQSTEPFRNYHRRLGVAAGQRIAVREGVYVLEPVEAEGQGLVVEALLALLAASSGFDRVVELGSGTGRNLFDLHEAAGRRELPLPPLHACELTAAGRRVTERLRTLYRGIDLTVHAFDYHAPRLGFLRGDENVLFFTAHSVEQIPFLEDRVVETMLQATVSCRCLHFEPVGWQTDPALVDWRRRRDGPLGPLLGWIARRPHRLARSIDRLCGTRLHRGFPGIRLDADDLGSDGRVRRNAARWSARLGYNANLLGLLRRLERESRIRIDRLTPDVAGANPFNPTSVVQWTSRRDG